MVKVKSCLNRDCWKRFVHPGIKAFQIIDKTIFIHNFFNLIQWHPMNGAIGIISHPVFQNRICLLYRLNIDNSTIYFGHRNYFITVILILSFVIFENLSTAVKVNSKSPAWAGNPVNFIFLLSNSNQSKSFWLKFKVNCLPSMSLK